MFEQKNYLNREWGKCFNAYILTTITCNVASRHLHIPIPEYFAEIFGLLEVSAFLFAVQPEPADSGTAVSADVHYVRHLVTSVGLGVGTCGEWIITSVS